MIENKTYGFSEGDFVYLKSRPEEIYLVVVEVVTLFEVGEFFVLQNIKTKVRNLYSSSESRFEKITDENKLRFLNLLYKL